MKVFISADLEGISGLVSWDQMKEGTPEYERAVDLMVKEVNSAVEGAVKGGADQVVVNDSHGYMRNINIENLHPKASLISGFTKPLSMVQGVEGSDLAFFIGYHAGVGTREAICDHSYSSGSVFQLKVNGVDFSETAINAAVCGHFGVPVALLTRDEQTVEQAKVFLPGALSVATKTGITRFSAHLRHPREVRAEIEEKAREAVEKFLQGNPNSPTFFPFTVKPPVLLEVTLLHTAKADVAELLPGVKRLDGRTLLFKAGDILEAFRALQAMLFLARPIS
ncbi:MAG: M55 family metallopeptidase [Caldiserica bacterium]|jgi:D-amino peptidase|nr:M55 family metallopeptidase [Caldisericota bacterium]MDH7562571.1 M55 family metallopeptidase [Caldisericota bacterium]